ncbi:RNA-directed DNA polymerase, eukaryota, reverse transcriptase zinc-binding domain protein [Tanacetum coccineum]
MNIELADNSKRIPKGIVRNLLIKIDKFILPIDFIILDILEDFRMPIILGRPLLATAHARVDVLKKSISLEVGNEKFISKMKSGLPDMQNESVLLIKSNIITEEDELMNIEFDLFTCYWESENDNNNENIEWNDLSLSDWLKIKFGEVEETMKKKILTEHWRKQFGVDYDDNDDFYDPDQCGEGRNNEIRERIINNLHEEWFKGTSDDEDDIEGIIDYLEPTSYEGFIDPTSMDI